MICDGWKIPRYKFKLNMLGGEKEFLYKRSFTMAHLSFKDKAKKNFLSEHHPFLDEQRYIISYLINHSPLLIKQAQCSLELNVGKEIRLYQKPEISSELKSLLHGKTVGQNVPPSKELTGQKPIFDLTLSNDLPLLCTL